MKSSININIKTVLVSDRYFKISVLFIMYSIGICHKYIEYEISPSQFRIPILGILVLYKIINMGVVMAIVNICNSKKL
jgi:hypothetical protein